MFEGCKTISATPSKALQSYGISSVSCCFFRKKSHHAFLWQDLIDLGEDRLRAYGERVYGL